jgi:hypothetical protein
MKKLYRALRKINNFLKKFSFSDILTISVFIGILCIAAAFFLRKSEYVYITLFISQEEIYSPVNKPSAWYLDALKPGLSEKDLLGRELITISDVYRYNATTPVKNNDIYVTLKIRSVYNKRTKQYSYNGNPLQIGTFQLIRFQNFVITGIIRSMGERNPKERQSFIIKGFLDPKNNDYPLKSDTNYLRTNIVDINGVPKSVTSKLSQGVKMLDSHKQTVAEITQISKKPGLIRIPQNGQIVSFEDPEKERIDLTVLVQAEQVDNKPFFQNEYPLSVNSLIELAFPDIIIQLTITDVQKMQ